MRVFVANAVIAIDRLMMSQMTMNLRKVLLIAVSFFAMGCEDEKAGHQCLIRIKPEASFLSAGVTAHLLSVRGPIRSYLFEKLTTGELVADMPVAKPFLLARIPMPVYITVKMGIGRDDYMYNATGGGFFACHDGGSVVCGLSASNDNLSMACTTSPR